MDGTSFAPLLKDSAAEIGRPEDALYFHRPGRTESALRQGDYKLMLKWKVTGEIVSRALYMVSKNPREEGRDIASDHPDRVAAMEKVLLDHLEAVDAEKPTPRVKKKRAKKGA